MRFIRSSLARLDKFKVDMKVTGIECKNKLCIDVLTRWNSTFLMLETTQQYRKTFD